LDRLGIFGHIRIFGRLRIFGQIEIFFRLGIFGQIVFFLRFGRLIDFCHIVRCLEVVQIQHFHYHLKVRIPWEIEHILDRSMKLMLQGVKKNEM